MLLATHIGVINLGDFWRKVVDTNTATMPTGSYAGESNPKRDDTGDVLLFDSEKGNAHWTPLFFVQRFRDQLPQERVNKILNSVYYSMDYIENFVMLDGTAIFFDGENFKLQLIENDEFGLDVYLTKSK